MHLPDSVCLIVVVLCHCSSQDVHNLVGFKMSWHTQWDGNGSDNSSVGFYPQQVDPGLCLCGKQELQSQHRRSKAENISQSAWPTEGYEQEVPTGRRMWTTNQCWCIHKVRKLLHENRVVMTDLQGTYTLDDMLSMIVRETWVPKVLQYLHKSTSIHFQFSEHPVMCTDNSFFPTCTLVKEMPPEVTVFT